MTTRDDIVKVTESLTETLLAKNAAYGDSATNPIRTFSKIESSTAGILVRIDDKLSRIKNSETLRQNDVCDLMGYLVLLCVDKGWVDYHPDEVMTIAEYGDADAALCPDMADGVCDICCEECSGKKHWRTCPVRNSEKNTWCGGHA